MFSFRISRCSRALDDTLCPEASSTDWEAIPKAILFIGTDQITSAAKDAVRKVEFLHAFPEGYILLSVPDSFQVTLTDIADDITFQMTFPSIQVRHVVVQ